MKLLQLDALNECEIDSLKESFTRLPHTEHKDGEYRLRRYSVVELRTSFWNAKEEVEIERLVHRDFAQSEDLNKHQGGMVRSFEEIEDETLQSEGMKKICLTFKRVNDLIDGQEVEIHQMRVKTLPTGEAAVSPEGVHQDGFDHIAMVGISRNNIDGGELMVYNQTKVDQGGLFTIDELEQNKPSPHPAPFLTYALKSGEMVMLDDRELWHDATRIKAINKNKEAFGDWFILCATK